MTEVPGGDMKSLLDALATDWGGDLKDLLADARRGRTPAPQPPPAPPAPAAAAPAPAPAVEPPQIHVEPQPWERPSWATAAAPVVRAGADIHMRSATAMAVCGATETPLASVADPTQVTCRACRLMISAPHISPCTTERWLRDTPAPEPEPVDVVDAPQHRGWRLGTAATVASVGIIAATAILGVVALVALSGHNGPSSSASNGAIPAIQTGGGVAEPTAFATALPTEAPTAAPTEAPTATPAPTQAPSAQNQTVNVINTNGQSQQQAQSTGDAQAQVTTADPPRPTSITFINDAGHVVDLYWDNGGNETLYNRITPGYQVVAHTYVGQAWDVRTDPCCVGGPGNVLLMQVTATATAQTMHVTAQ